MKTLPEEHSPLMRTRAADSVHPSMFRMEMRLELRPPLSSTRARGRHRSRGDSSHPEGLTCSGRAAALEAEGILRDALRPLQRSPRSESRSIARKLARAVRSLARVLEARVLSKVHVEDLLTSRALVVDGRRAAAARMDAEEAERVVEQLGLACQLISQALESTASYGSL